MMGDEETRVRERGAYGLRISGVRGAERLLIEADSAWPELEIVAECGSIAGFRDRVDDEEATVVLLGAVAFVRRIPGQAVFRFEAEPSTDALVHPYLAPVAGLFSHWLGRESLHAGAFVAGDGAWGVLAEREGGKSSTLARLALDGVPIVADDVLVIEGDRVFAGPRAIDLRREPAEALGAGKALGVVGTRERWRLALGETAGAFPLLGWVFLAWGNEPSLSRVPAGECLRRLAGERTIRLIPRDPASLLSLAALPAFELRRPRRWSSLEQAASLLLASLP